MARATTKEDTRNDGIMAFDKLWDLIDSMSFEQQNAEFSFEDRDRNLRDVLVHLYEWHQLLLKWISSNMNGEKKSFLPEPYNWRTYPDMNVELWKKHQTTSLEEAKRMLQGSHKDILALLESFDNDQLFKKKYFDWTASATLGSYFVSTLSSHYEWAIKKIRKHKKTFA